MADLSRNALARKRLAEQWDDDPTGQKAADREALYAAYDSPTIAGKILSVIPGFDTANALSRSKQPAAGAAAAAGRMIAALFDFAGHQKITSRFRIIAGSAARFIAR
mgnify:CR=1 FL=1